MSSDKARVSYDANQQYRTVVAQQGRVTLEADWNEAQQIASEEEQANLLDIIGSSGTPNDGYRVLETGTQPTIPFDFSVQKGTMYVGGNRVALPSKVQYSNQSEWLDRVGDPDWVDPSIPNTPSPQKEFIYLLLREQEVSAVEDSDLRDSALGGPDTTQRTRLIQRIVRLQTDKDTCAIALDSARQYWLKNGLTFDSKTMRLKSAATLQVKFLASALPPDSCDPEARGGYLGAENQLIRVQISSIDLAKNQYKLVWGFDNASFLYRVTVNNTGRILKLQSPPADDFHRPRTGQAVEVLRSAASLSNGEFVASATGKVVTLRAPYNPDTQEINLPEALPDPYSSQTPRLFLRVWEEEITFTSNNPVSLGETGLQVILTNNSGTFHVGDYWLFAVRPMTPTPIYPERYLTTPQPPEGPDLWVCPLAVISWNNRTLKVLEDCRQHFDDLVKLTKRQSGCCTVVVKPEDLKGNITLQAIIDRFASRDRANREHITICLSPGIYRLPKSLQLDSQHSNFTLEGCGDGAELQAELGQEKDFLHGLIVLNRANYVTLRNLRFQLPIVPFERAGGKLTPYVLFGEINRNFQKTLRVSIGIRPLHCALLTVQNCLFRFEVQTATNLFAVGIFADSECWGLNLCNNRFLGDEEYLLTQEKINETENSLLIGYLLFPSLISTKEPKEFNIVPSLLQDAVICNNQFTGLTTGMLISADTGMIRVENNTVFQCISGFLLAPINSISSQVNGITVLLGFSFPLPDFFDVSKLVLKFDGNLQNITGMDRLDLSLHMSFNDINTLVNEESPILSGSCLEVAGNKPLKVDNLDRLTTSSVLLTANKFRSHISGDNFKPVWIHDVEICTVTGNVILNVAPSGGVKFSLEMSEISTAIAVTGNIFQGAPRLPTRNMLDPLDFQNTWEFLNTVID